MCVFRGADRRLPSHRWQQEVRTHAQTQGHLVIFFPVRKTLFRNEIMSFTPGQGPAGAADARSAVSSVLPQTLTVHLGTGRAQGRAGALCSKSEDSARR